MGGDMKKFIIYSIFFIGSLTASDWPASGKTLLKLPHVRAYLDTISYAEGTYHEKGYYSFFGGGYFSTLKDHPRTIMCYMSSQAPLCSTAAGRYQILERTWDKFKKELQLKDFSATSQDILALALIRDMGALQYVKKGNVKKACKLLNRVWASLPGAQYQQRVCKLEELEKFYKQRLDYYKKYR